MIEILNVLLVDDHPFAIEAYERAFEYISLDNKNIKFNINKAIDCDSADLKINEAKKDLPLDLVLLDISLPPSKNRKILSGEDLGVKIKKLFSNAKLIILTSHNDNHKLCNIFKALNPDGFLIKSDFSHKDLISAINDVINDSPYYSKTVNKLIRQHMSNQIVVTQVDREILYHLSNGAKMKDLPPIVNLSLAGIERRKRQLKAIFNTGDKDDKTLIEKAKEKGFV